ncbi:MAG: hypothetical protein OdinLCB4_000280 [Candidatus Odinarchaeum yellowstonii]|uniref:Uncharacterized protein n=1 Tax=Odinarchaeota yellowstonii (strain LCB_4) TaxID=1841599 RepID=A0AAF0IC39_ODILC|nr:MAG: hypothetical protein OdinLCB4_000280 [Candidatus Odinarchaeum yellowstonii]
MDEDVNLNEKLSILRDSLLNFYTTIFSKMVMKYGGDAAQLLSKEKDEVFEKILNHIKSYEESVGREGLLKFYEKYMTLFGFKTEVKTLSEDVISVKVTKCPIMEIGGAVSSNPLCRLICLPGSKVIADVFNPGFVIEILESKWEGDEACKIHLKQPPQLMSLEEVLDKITDLKPYNCPYRNVDTPCVFCEEVDCDKCDYEEYSLANGLAKKCVNSAILSLNLPVKDELDTYIIRKLTRGFGEEGVFRVMSKPEQGYHLSFFFMSNTGERRDKVKTVMLSLLENIKGFLAEGRVVINNWVDKKRSEFVKTFKEEGKIPSRITRILECPYCSTKIKFTMDSTYFEKVNSYPIPFSVQHGDHSFKIYLDEDLNVVKIEKI